MISCQAISIPCPVHSCPDAPTARPKAREIPSPAQVMAPKMAILMFPRRLNRRKARLVMMQLCLPRLDHAGGRIFSSLLRVIIQDPAAIVCVSAVVQIYWTVLQRKRKSDSE
ncbi:hypothetical protein BJY01DRAFT_201505 [Aspergillus pseudoustus]|uniref:Uncharacterized protein n=1 Tax=Aspergillus pseudoustus TaxID=1810923 RepID=A0ABR4L045_9EURO